MVLAAVLAGAIPCAGAETVRLVAGPLVGAPLAREVGLWLRLDGPAEVVAEAYPEADPGRRVRSAAVATDGADGWTVRLALGPLQPGTRYRYRIVANGTPLALPGQPGFSTAPDWRDRAPPPDATFAVLGTHAAPDPQYDPPYRPAGAGFELLTLVSAARPDFVLWVGGQAPLRPGDDDSAMARRERITQSRQGPEIAGLLASTGHLGVLAPADFGPPAAGAWWPAGADARAAHRRAWPLSASFAPEAATVHGIFRWADAAFFVVDGSSARRDHRNPARRARLGTEQLDWLLEALERTPATFRFVVAGQPLLAPVDEPSHWHHAREEQQAFIEALTQREIAGVILLAGGPAGEATRAVRARGYDLHEFVAGPSTARPDPAGSGLNYFRIPATQVSGRHALLVSLRGPEDDRKVVVTSVGADGTTHWTSELSARQLR